MNDEKNKTNYQNLNEENCIVVKTSESFKKLRKKGLKILNRTKLLSTEEWWNTATERLNSPKYNKFLVECWNLGEIWGLAGWTIELLCLLRGYAPEKESFTMELPHLQATIIAKFDNEFLLQYCAGKARAQGFNFIHKSIDNEIQMVYPFPPPEISIDKKNLSPVSSMYLRIEIPTTCPPRNVRAFVTESLSTMKDFQRELGYKIPKRLRVLKLSKQSEQLRVGKKLKKGEVYDILDKYQSNGSSEELAEDSKRRRKIISRRQNIKKHYDNKSIGNNELFK